MDFLFYYDIPLTDTYAFSEQEVQANLEQKCSTSVDWESIPPSLFPCGCIQCPYDKI